MVSQVESTRLSTSAYSIGELLDAFQAVHVLLGRRANGQPAAITLNHIVGFLIPKRPRHWSD